MLLFLLILQYIFKTYDDLNFVSTDWRRVILILKFLRLHIQIMGGIRQTKHMAIHISSSIFIYEEKVPQVCNTNYICKNNRFRSIS